VAATQTHALPACRLSILSSSQGRTEQSKAAGAIRNLEVHARLSWPCGSRVSSFYCSPDTLTGSRHGRSRPANPAGSTPTRRLGTKRPNSTAFFILLSLLMRLYLAILTTDWLVRTPYICARAMCHVWIPYIVRICRMPACSGGSGILLVLFAMLRVPRPSCCR
jgi:hypothetical protein